MLEVLVTSQTTMQNSPFLPQSLYNDHEIV